MRNNEMVNTTKNPTIAVILVNLGTPDEPTAPAVRRYLRQFLSDGRVIEIPAFVWQIILNLFVLPFRPKRVAHAYSTVWQGDSPMRLILNEQVELLQQRLANFGDEVKVYPAMTYGNPSLKTLLENLHKNQVEKMIIFPLYPQYSATTTGAVFDVVARFGMNQRNLPSITFIKDYYNHPLLIEALAKRIQRFQAEHGKPEKLLFSFHGIPQPYADKGDPYPQRCQITAELTAKALGLQDNEWAISFQSRFGKQEWVKPYTDALLTEWGKQGVKSVQVLSPAFSADCLETLEELAVENKDTFQENGGGDYHYIPALNSDKEHIDLLVKLVMPHVQAWHEHI